MAYSYTQPDVVIFMGDLIDEGSKATKDEYVSYVERLQDIFQMKQKSKVVLKMSCVCIGLNYTCTNRLFRGGGGVNSN